MEQLLSVEEVSSLLQVPKKTVYAWRAHGSGPRAIKVGKHLRFRRSDVLEWIEARADRAS